MQFHLCDFPEYVNPKRQMRLAVAGGWEEGERDCVMDMGFCFGLKQGKCSGLEEMVVQHGACTKCL